MENKKAGEKSKLRGQMEQVEKQNKQSSYKAIVELNEKSRELIKQRNLKKSW